MSEARPFSDPGICAEKRSPLAIDLAAAEGWNPGLNDAECFFAADVNGFLIGELAGKMVGWRLIRFICGAVWICGAVHCAT